MTTTKNGCTGSVHAGAIVAVVLATGCNHTIREEGIATTSGAGNGDSTGGNGDPDDDATTGGSAPGADDGSDGGTKLDVGAAYDLGTPDAECPGPPPAAMQRCRVRCSLPTASSRSPARSSG